MKTIKYSETDRIGKRQMVEYILRNTPSHVATIRSKVKDIIRGLNSVVVNDKNQIVGVSTNLNMIYEEQYKSRL